MTIIEELYHLSVGKPDMLTKQQQRMIKRLIAYPHISKAAFITAGVVVGLIIVASISINQIYGKSLSARSLYMGISIVVVLTVVGIATWIYSQGKINSTQMDAAIIDAVDLVKNTPTDLLYGIVVDRKKANWLHQALRDPVILAEFYHLKVPKHNGVVVAVVGIIAVLAVVIPSFVSGHNDFVAMANRVIATQDIITKEYKDICEDISAYSPYERRISSSYTVHMRTKDGYNTVAGITLYVDRDGKIDALYLIADFDKDKTAEENIEITNELYAEYLKHFNNLSDHFKYSDMVQLKYSLNGEFADNIKKVHGTDEDYRNTTRIDTDEGRFSIYETYYGSSGSIHVSPIYTNIK